jgi:tetratricopeptide (TPR) repeat protein
MNISHSITHPQSQQAEQQQALPAGPQIPGLPLPAEITLKILDYVGDEPVTRNKMRGVSKLFELFVNDNSFWRSFAPTPDVIPSPNQRRSGVLTGGPTGVLATARMPRREENIMPTARMPRRQETILPTARMPRRQETILPTARMPRRQETILPTARMPRRQETILPTPPQVGECAARFRATVMGLQPPERDVLRELLTHEPGATQRAKKALAGNSALRENPVFIAAALHHDHFFLSCGSMLFAEDSGYAEFLGILAGLNFMRASRREEVEPSLRAEAALRTSLRKNPRLLTSQFYLGSVLQSQGKNDAALVVFDDLLAKRPDYGSAHYARGVLCYDQGRDTEALRHFNAAENEQPALMGIKLYQGRILMEQERFEEAALAFSDYRRFVTNSSEAASGEAIAQYHLNRNDIALEICDTFLERYPGDVLVHFARGNFHLHASAVSVEALADFDAILAVEPQHEMAIANRNRVLRNREILRIGLEQFDRVSAAGDDRLGEAYVDRAILYYQMRHYTQATDDLMQASRLCDSTNLALLQAAICLQLGDPDLAASFHAVAVKDGAEAYAVACAKIWPSGDVPRFTAAS